MKEKTSALNSEYIIDGIHQQLTPAEILDDCLSESVSPKAASGEFEPIVDETKDPSPTTAVLDGRKFREYLSRTLDVLASPRECPMIFAGPYTRSRIAKALLDALWLRGHFRLSDLVLNARWKWNTKELGNMAAFYSSVEDAADAISSLGIALSGYSFSESLSDSNVAFKVGAADTGEELDEDEEIFLPGDAPFGTEHPRLGRKRIVADKLVADKESWIIYIPFDPCEYRLGGSALCSALGITGTTFPKLDDEDYFIDCYEVIREFVEDGVLLAGATVCDGGLASALKQMCSDGVGATADINAIMKAYGEDRISNVLFSEVPGVIVQIRDIDYDYVDAELLLQDIAYYPVGHPVIGSSDMKVRSGGASGISSILESLLNSQASEGED